MAISWNCEITNVDVEKKRADVSFVRTDDSTGNTENYTFRKTPIGEPAERLALLNTAWDKHLEAASNQAAVDEFVTNLEQLAKSNLEAREI